MVNVFCTDQGDGAVLRERLMHMQAELERASQSRLEAEDRERRMQQALDEAATRCEQVEQDLSRLRAQRYVVLTKHGAPTSD